jgi:hypothetical protein
MTNQPAEGTFSRLMATTVPMREKQQEEQGKATRPPVATVTPSVVKTPQPQTGKNQRTLGKKPANQQTPKSINALQQNGVSYPAPQSETNKRPVKPRHGFDIYWDQYEALVKWSNEEKLQGGTGSMSAMAREALDDYIAKRKKK